jgi:WD40 repeat protein
MSANGEQAISRGYGRAVFVIPLNGNEPRQFEGFSSADVVDAVGFSPSGRLAAAATMITEGQATLRVWDLDTDEMTAFDQPEDPEAYQGYFALDLSFVDETALFTAGANGLLRWDIKAGTSERVLGAPPGGLLKMRMTFDRQSMLVTEIGPSLARTGGAILYDLATGEVRSLEIPGDGLLVALSADGAFWVAGDSNGSIWVGRADGGEPHLLLGHGAEVFPMAISPDNRWIASSSITDKTLRLWPMPDLSKPPLHTLPHDELIAKLKTLTNLRVVRDEESATGWKVEVGPFPGWETVPEW